MPHPDPRTERTQSSASPQGGAHPAPSRVDPDGAARRLLAEAELVRLTAEVLRMEAEVEAKR